MHRGMEGWSEDLARCLFKKGIDITLFKGAGPKMASYETVLSTPKRDGLVASIIAKLTAKVAWRIGLGSPQGVESFVFGLRLLRHLREGYDIAHVKQGQLALLLHRAKKLRLLDTSVVLSNGQIADESFLSLFDYVQHLTICRETPICNARILGKIPPNRFIIPNFVDTKLFAPQDRIYCRKRLGLPQNALIVLSVGAVKKTHKRMDYFLEESLLVARDAAKVPLHFLIAGAQDPETKNIMTLGREKLGKKLTILLDVPRSNMPLVYGAADVLVLCSQFEAFGTVLIEAMSCELPVIAHRHGSFDWIIQKGGTLTDMTQRGSLSALLKRYIQDRSFRSSQASLARKRVLSHFSEEVVVDQMLDMYHQILVDRK